MHKNTSHAVPLTWLLLESQSMVDLISNKKMLVNIRKMWGKDTIRLHCNSGANIVNMVGDLPGYGTVWNEPTGIANVLSMSKVTKKIRVAFNSEGWNFSRMVLPDREVIFQLSPNGLYYFDAAYRESSALPLDTVSENCEGFTQREFERDQGSRQAMHLLGFPSERDFENMVCSKMTVNR